MRIVRKGGLIMVDNAFAFGQLFDPEPDGSRGACDQGVQRDRPEDQGPSRRHRPARRRLLGLREGVTWTRGWPRATSGAASGGRPAGRVGAAGRISGSTSRPARRSSATTRTRSRSTTRTPSSSPESRRRPSPTTAGCRSASSSRPALVRRFLAEAEPHRPDPRSVLGLGHRRDRVRAGAARRRSESRASRSSPGSTRARFRSDDDARVAEILAASRAVTGEGRRKAALAARRGSGTRLHRMIAEDRARPSPANGAR